MCNAPRPMCQVSCRYSLVLPCHCLCVMHCISCHHVYFICIRVRLMHPSIFPVVRFEIGFSRFSLLSVRSPDLSRVPRRPSQTLFRVRVLNVLGMDRVLPSGLGIAPVDCLSSFVPFGLRLILQRLTEEPKRPRVCYSPTPLQSGPKPT